MARPIVIEFAANVRDFLRGSRDVERATEDIADELQAATKDADRFEREFQESMRDAERAAGKTSRSVEDDFRGMSGEMGDIGQDAGDELVSNLGEAVSSGDIGGLIEGTLGGIVGGLKGPMGIAAAGLAGVAVVAFQQVREEAERMAAWSESWADGFRDQVAQARDELKQEDIQAGFEQWLADNEESFLNIAADLEQLGIDANEFATALYAGGEPAQQMMDAINAMREGSTRLEEVGGRLRPVYDDTADAVGNIQTEMLNIVDTQQDTIDDAKTMAKFVGEDNVQAVTDLRKAWRDANVDIAKPVTKQVTIQTTVKGDGQAYVNPSSGRYTPSSVAGSGIYAGNRTGAAR